MIARPDQPPIYISLGAGVQSSTMALMSSRGDLPQADGAVFADTQNESEATYAWLDWLEPQLAFPLYRVTVGDLFDASMIVRVSKNTGKPYLRNLVPAFVSMPTGEDDGKLRQGCTRDFKIRPIERKVKELAGVPRRREKGRVYATSWVGISLDEISRMKPSAEPWVDRQYPLIDKRMTRLDCLAWMERGGFPRPVPSSCVFCPHHSNRHWRGMSDNDMARAVAFERSLQAAGREIGDARGTAYLHGGMKPLDETDFSDDQPGQGFLFLCDGGVCGV